MCYLIILHGFWAVDTSLAWQLKTKSFKAWIRLTSVKLTVFNVPAEIQVFVYC